MFCHNCGETLIEESSFCSNCGATVYQNQEPIASIEDTTPKQATESTEKVQSQNKSPQLSVQATEQIHQTNEKRQPEKKSTFQSKLPILIPVISFVLVSIILVFYFISEQKKNDMVLEIQQDAETAALAGEYDTAISALNEAIDTRPDYEVLQLNLEEIKRAQGFSAQLDNVMESITNQEFDMAEGELSTLKEHASSDTSPLFAPFHEVIATGEENITIGKIKQEIDSLTSVDALANNLSKLETVSTAEAEDIRTQILDKIVQMTNDEASELLAENLFAEALNTVNKGLNYKSNDEQLLSLKDEIEQAKMAYEEQTAEEDLHNRTAAVEIADFNATLEENGDITIEGTVVSTATIPIYTLTVFYAVYDLDGNFIVEGYVNVEPDLLDPGDEGTFQGVIEGVNQEANVEIFNITWYFDI